MNECILLIRGNTADDEKKIRKIVVSMVRADVSLVGELLNLFEIQKSLQMI